MLESKRFSRTVLAAVAATTLVTFAPRDARAEDVSPDGKGIIGGALIGGELVIFTEAIIGVRSPLAYGLGAGAGAVAGGFGGFAIESAVSDGRIPAYILAGGLALLIPAVVVMLDQTRYLPAEGAREDKPVSTPPSDPGKPGGSAVIGAEPAAAPASPVTTPPATTPGAATPAPPSGGSGGGTKAQERAPVSSLFDVRKGGLRVGVPVPEVRPVFTAQQKKALGVDERTGNATEVRFPVVSVSF